jgi:sugar lactone lactonase YvrE
MLSAAMLATTHTVDAASGIITTFAGSAGDGGPATSARLYHPKGVALDGSGNVYVADTEDCLVRKVSGATITTVAGYGGCIYGGDGGAATSASLNQPSRVVLDVGGNLYVADPLECRVREVSGGTITTVAGNGSCTYSGDGGAATSASLSITWGVALDGSGNLYIADSGNCRVRKVSSGTITTVAGNGACTYSGDGRAATSASLYDPTGLALDSNPRLNAHG